MDINMNPDVRVYWIATIIYGVAALLYILSFVQKKENFSGLAMKFAWTGLIVHVLGTFYPAITHKYTHICSFYKVMGGTTMIGMFVFLTMSAVKKEIKPAALLILPLFFGFDGVGRSDPVSSIGTFTGIQRLATVGPRYGRRVQFRVCFTCGSRGNALFT